jgi:hypothetical protein
VKLGHARQVWISHVLGWINITLAIVMLIYFFVLGDLKYLACCGLNFLLGVVNLEDR